MEDQDLFTAVAAAVVAATASLLAAILSAISSRRNDARSAHRAVLEAVLADLGENIAGVVATASVYLKRQAKEQDLTSWRTRMESHGDELKALRARVRYPLFGIEKGLLTLSRVASWIQHFGTQPAAAERLLHDADHLRRQLDLVIAKSYRRGEPPTRLDQWRVSRRANTVEQRWNEHRKAGAAQGKTDRGEHHVDQAVRPASR